MFGGDGGDKCGSVADRIASMRWSAPSNCARVYRSERTGVARSIESCSTLGGHSPFGPDGLRGARASLPNLQGVDFVSIVLFVPGRALVALNSSSAGALYVG